MSRPPSTQINPTPELGPGKSYPYIIQRAYLCGHPDECIEVGVDSSQYPVIQHTYIPLPRRTHRYNPYQQSLERCPSCAKEFQVRRCQEKPREPVRKLATHQGQAQGGEGHIKDGFLQALAWYRFQSAPHLPVGWKNEGPGDAVHNFLKDIYTQAKAERNCKPHPEVSYQSRRDKHVIGPVWPRPNPETSIEKNNPTTAEANKMLTYTIVVHVDEALMPRRLPTPPPEAQRHSDSVLLGENPRGWPDENNVHATVSLHGAHGSKRDSGGTSLSLGDQPTNNVEFPSRTDSIRGRGGQPLPVLRNRRDILKERIAPPSPKNAGHQAPQNPRRPSTPGNLGNLRVSGGNGRRVFEQPDRSPYGCFDRGLYEDIGRENGPNGGSNRGSQEGRAQQQSERRSPYEDSTRSPYEYLPHTSPDASLPGVHGSPRRWSNGDHRSSNYRVLEGVNRRSHRGRDPGSREYPNCEVPGSPHRGAIEDINRDPDGYSPRGHQEGANRGSFGSAHSNSSQRTRLRAEPNQLLQPNPRDQDYGSDASSVGKW